MYYGNATCVNQQNPSGVWDTYFHGVWHLNESSGSTSDSTSYSNDGTVYNSPQYNVAGKIAGAMQFDGDLFSGDYISCGDPVDGSLDFGTGDFTIACWVKTTQEDWVSLIHKIDITDAGPEGYALCMEDGKLFALLAENNALHILDVGKKFIADGQWHHIAVVFDRDIEATYYIDGTVDTGTKISMWTGSTSNTLPFWIARQYDGFNKYFLGTMDEIRVSNSTRSQAWVNTSYRNQNSTSTFYTVGDPTTRYFTVSIENIGTINHNTEGFVLLINGTIYQCTSDSHYLFPLNTIHIYTTTRIASGAKKIKVITDNGIEDEYNYTGAGGVE